MIFCELLSQIQPDTLDESWIFIVWLRITSSDLNALDLHDLSPGAASCAISWWLRQHGYWSGRHPMGALRWRCMEIGAERAIIFLDDFDMSFLYSMYIFGVF